MALTCEPTELPEVLLLKPDVFQDNRGFFGEIFHAPKYQALGLQEAFVQDNHSHSRRDVLRGLHYQLRHPQGKLVTAISGAIFDVAVDIRVGSPRFGRWVGRELSAENRCQLYVPAGFAHGFCVLSEGADVLYKCTGIYQPHDDRGLRWSDPALQIAWPVRQPVLSPKDERLPLLAEIARAELPPYAS